MPAALAPGGAQIREGMPMQRLRSMNDVQLDTHIRDLERDVERFRRSAAAEAAALFARKSGVSDALYGRFSAIHAFLVEQLLAAQREAHRRRSAAKRRPPLSLTTALCSLVRQVVRRIRSAAALKSRTAAARYGGLR
jgi:hypothetical protein